MCDVDKYIDNYVKEIENEKLELDRQKLRAYNPHGSKCEIGSKSTIGVDIDSLREKFFEENKDLNTNETVIVYKVLEFVKKKLED